MAISTRRVEHDGFDVELHEHITYRSFSEEVCLYIVLIDGEQYFLNARWSPWFHSDNKTYLDTVLTDQTKGFYGIVCEVVDKLFEEIDQLRKQILEEKYNVQ